jgi:hypothetical protein
MKTIWIWVLGIGALAVCAYLLLKSKATRGTRPTAQTTGTQTAQAPWLPGWQGFTTNAMNNVGSNVRSAFNRIFGLSNNFGANDGGTNPGVSVSGSHVGGTQSSAGGAGVPVDTLTVQSVQTDPADQFGAAPLNGYDESDFSNFGGFDDSGY